MTATRKDALRNRIKRVCEYIDQQPDKAWTLSELAQIASYSPYHFGRIFTAVTGVGTTKYIQLSRLRRSSFRIAFEPDTRLIDIAVEAGFDSHEAFSRAFKRIFGQTPSSFRAKPNWPNWHESFAIINEVDGTIDMNVDIKTIEPMKVAMLEHKGDPAKLYETVGHFIDWRKKSGLSPVATSETFGIPNGDPTTMKPEEFTFKVCSSVTREIPVNDHGVTNTIIPGGKHAVVRHIGSPDKMGPLIYSLFRDWLPDSGEEPADAPLFFQYQNLVHEVAESDLITDIYVPLK